LSQERCACENGALSGITSSRGGEVIWFMR
jgi:hypothetical protein